MLGINQMHRKFRLLTGLGIMGGMTVVFMLGYWPGSEVKISSERIVKQPQIESVDLPVTEKRLHSHIPAYDLAAVHLFLEATPLRRVQLEYINEEDSPYDESLVLLDKVIVIPKDLQPQTKHIS